MRKFKIDFHTHVTANCDTLCLIRNNHVFEEKTGGEAVNFMIRLCRIEELVSMGFRYMDLDYDGSICEWYEMVMVMPSNSFEGVTLLYHPDRDLFEVAETGMTFTEMKKCEAMIKAFQK